MYGMPIDTLLFYLDFAFVRYAIIVGVLVSLCSSLLGVTLILKRYSYIGDGLSHVAFGALAIAAVLKVTNNMLIILPATIAVAVLLLCTGKNARIKGDAAVAMVSVGALAIGYLGVEYSTLCQHQNRTVQCKLFLTSGM